MSKTSVLVTFFNRPEPLKELLETLEQVPNLELYFASDGPRDTNDNNLLKDCWDLINSSFKEIPESHKLVRDHNLGCKTAMQQNISWFFSIVKKGIILEDDCLPSLDFFELMRFGLEEYEENLKYFSISGTDVIPESYIFQSVFRESVFPMVWGWATWADRWENYQVEIPDVKSVTRWPSLILYKPTSQLKAFLFRSIFKFRFFEVEKGFIDTWDYSLTATCWRQRKMSLQINGNQVRNIGFGKTATHTKQSAPNWVPQNFGKIPNVLAVQEYDPIYDRWLANRVFRISLKEFLKNLVKKMVIYFV
jgi:hypothetical protein